MFISFKNLALPKDYKLNPHNLDNIFRDIAYVKQRMGGFQKLEGVEYNDYENYKRYIFYDDILPNEIVTSFKKVPLLTKVVEIKNKEKYRVKKIKVYTGAENSITRIYLDVKFHPHVDDIKKYCAPSIVMTGSFSSFKFEKLRTSLYRWNLPRCYKENIPPIEDFILSPIFVN